MGCLPMLKLKVMKTFDDLKFEVHPVTKKGIRASLELKPNVFISVVAGEGFYSNGKTGVRGPITKVEDVSSFEVAIIDENLPEDEQEWEVSGWQSRKDISKLMIDHG
jgi:hypothetical protein